MASATGDTHESQQARLRASTIALVILAAVFVALRFSSRWKKRLSIGIDDYTLLVALVPCLLPELILPNC